MTPESRMQLTLHVRFGGGPSEKDPPQAPRRRPTQPHAGFGERPAETDRRQTPAPRPRPTQPEKAAVVWVDEKSQVQAPGRTAPMLPVRPGLAERRIHEDIRHGTTSLFAALEVATGKVTDRCYDRRTHAEFLAFLKLLARAYPRVKLHVVVDNYATHKHLKITAWLAKNPRVTMHVTPTSASWLNMVEIFFGIITRQAIRRGTFTSVKELVGAIETFIDGWNDRREPFVWTKTADDILGKATRP
jgi:transposase